MKKNKSFLLIAAVLTFLFTLTPTHMLAQENIVDRLDKELGITLPKEYQNVVKVFVDTSQVLKYDKYSDAADFTANFIKHKMKYNWNINKQNQLLFIWHSIYQQCTNKDLYDGEDGNDKRLEECEEAIDSIDLCGLTYKNEFVAHMNKLTAEARQQSAEARQQSAEAKLVSFTNCINKYNDFINENNDFLDMTMVKEARNIISEYNQKIGEFKKRVENLATRLNSQNLSESEMESIKNMAGQLCTDIDAQRTAMLKQRIVIVEKACVVVENKISEIQKKIAGIEDANIKPFADGAKERINDVKKYIGKAKTNNNEDNLLSAEVYIVSAEAKRQSAESEKRIAEARQQSAEARQQSKELTIIGLNQLIDFYVLYKKMPSSVHKDEMEQMKKGAIRFISNSKEYNIDYKAILRKGLGDDNKVKELLKFYGVE